ncbi:response regulator [Shewanella sp. VB17]|uniref:ATP-binding protein n=1 Tax=Shewanella sp. VB17 TaxID=2739432 RepID=UPI001562F5EF|nr:ATP-binding protein [Shewanella sp. VB17]NRD73722.1 response regulator [Shewanella sp. VB17]
MNNENTELKKKISLLTKKVAREQQARLAAEMLLDEKSRELYLAKQLVEDNLHIVQEKSDQGMALITLKSYLDSILLNFTQSFLQKPMTNTLLQLLVDDLAAVETFTSVLLTFIDTNDKTQHIVLNSGSPYQWHSIPNLKACNWNNNANEITMFINSDDTYLGSLKIALSVPIRWTEVIEKQLLLFTDMLCAAYQRQALLERTLAQKQRAEQSESSTRDFVAMINHELRTPLNGLLGSTELMLQTPMSVYQTTLIQTMFQSGELLKVIINDLLDVSKINAGMLQLNEIAFSTQQLCDMIRDLFKAPTMEKSLDFEFHYHNNIPNYLLGDPDRIKQIFVNLIGNAIKFTEKGQISVEVYWLNERFYFSISDTGFGIAPEHIDAIFKPFTQANNRSNRHFEGTGLGLTICTLLVNAMNGSITLNSDINIGSTFSVSLPLKEIQAPSHQLDTVSTTSFKQLSILVVEDSQTNQMLIKLMLAKLEITPKILSNGQEALDYLEKNDVDLILMDCRMPIIDGYQATAALRAKGYVKPIIALTAGTTSTEQDLCKAVGMNDLISKPYKMQELSVMLTKWKPNKNTL